MAHFLFCSESNFRCKERKKSFQSNTPTKVQFFSLSFTEKIDAVVAEFKNRDKSKFIEMLWKFLDKQNFYAEKNL